MNNDRELLELAAKAAGELTPDWYGNKAYFDGVMKRWNPLTNDGDALRLEVNLGLHLFQSKHFVRCARKTIDEPIEESKREQDPYAATRRAIVRAAAEIGKELS